MNSKKPIIVKRSAQPEASAQPEVKPSRRSRLVQKSDNVEQVQQIDVEQPEQPEPVIQLQSVAEPPIDQSIYGSGWSVAELMNQFSGRYYGWCSKIALMSFVLASDTAYKSESGIFASLNFGYSRIAHSLSWNLVHND